jgi:hypothetical protein
MLRTLLAIGLLGPSLFSQSAPPLSPEQKEAFLQTAKVIRMKSASKGITGTARATLSDGTITHDASIQTIDERRTKFETPSGTEFNFQDSYRLNIAAYRLGRMLGLESMIPVSVERSYAGKKGSFTWWVEDVQMDEGDRMKKKIDAPDKNLWSRQYLIMRVFDQLIYNVDRNVGNMLYDKDWKLWLIDHSRAFRRHNALQNAKMLDRCDAELLKRIRNLNQDDLDRELAPWLEPGQVKAVLARAKLIVSHFDGGGPSKLYEYLPPEGTNERRQLAPRAVQ